MQTVGYEESHAALCKDSDCTAAGGGTGVAVGGGATGRAVGAGADGVAVAEAAGASATGQFQTRVAALKERSAQRTGLIDRLPRVGL